MSQILIRKALEKRLATIASPLAQASENTSYTPVTGTPYQRINLLPATPDNAMRGTASHWQRGIFQVMLCYPLNDGVRNVETRAELIQALFKRGTTMVESGLRVLVIKTPAIGGPVPDVPDRYCVPVSITYESQILTP